MGAGRAPPKKKGELGEGSWPCLNAFSSVIPAALGKLVSGSSGLLRNKVGRHPQPPHPRFPDPTFRARPVASPSCPGKKHLKPFLEAEPGRNVVGT